MLAIVICIMTTARMYIECHKLQNRRFSVPGHPLVHYIKAVFSAIDKHVCLFVTCMAKEMDSDDLSCLRPNVKIIRSES